MTEANFSNNKAFTVEKLNDTNYTTLRIEMEMILRREDLMKYVDGKTKVPENEKSADGKALVTIFPRIVGCTTAQEAWSNLRTHYTT